MDDKMIIMVDFIKYILQTIEIRAIFVYKHWKTAFESLSRDFSSFKNVVVSLKNMCQGQLKISRENAKLPRKPRNRKRKNPKDIF